MSILLTKLEKTAPGRLWNKLDVMSQRMAHVSISQILYYLFALRNFEYGLRLFVFFLSFSFALQRVPFVGETYRGMEKWRIGRTQRAG